jgi:hypothetical protein
MSQLAEYWVKSVCEIGPKIVAAVEYGMAVAEENAHLQYLLAFVATMLLVVR